MTGVFVSYSSKDLDILTPIVRMMHKNNILFFKAPESIPQGSNYAKEIPGAIREYKVFLLLISGDSQRSAWVAKEVEFAINSGSMIVPVQITRVPLDNKYKLYLSDLEIIKYYENQNDGLRQLEIKLKQLTRKDISPFDEDVSNETEENQEAADYPGDDTGELTGVERELLELKRKKEKKMTGIIKTVSKTENGKAANPFTETKQEKKRTLTPHRIQARRQNAVSMNHIPEECEYCKGELMMCGKGAYKCEECGKISYDSFQKIKNFLDEHGPTPAVEVSAQTGLPKEMVEYLLLEEHLEIPRSSSVMLACQNCGAAIRSGRLCDMCKKRVQLVKPMDPKEKNEAKFRYAYQDKK